MNQTGRTDPNHSWGIPKNLNHIPVEKKETALKIGPDKTMEGLFPSKKMNSKNGLVNSLNERDRINIQLNGSSFDATHLDNLLLSKFSNVKEQLANVNHSYVDFPTRERNMIRPSTFSLSPGRDRACNHTFFMESGPSPLVTRTKGYGKQSNIFEDNEKAALKLRSKSKSAIRQVHGRNIHEITREDLWLQTSKDRKMRNDALKGQMES